MTGDDEKQVFIVPETHWDREWYEPFQKFRFKLVKLIDTCLGIDKPGYFFMLDGQTVVLEDYLEIKPENKAALAEAIREGRIGAGPWYLLPDEWLAGAESIIRNLERAFYIGQRLDIPLMPVGYLPDCFGHTRAIPQILADLTNCKAAVVWRGVPPSIKAMPFTWKSHESSTASIPGIYLPEGYGNAANLADDFNAFTEQVYALIEILEPYSPVPVFLLMNGSDHLFPQPYVLDYINRLNEENTGTNYSLGSLDKFVVLLEEIMAARGYVPPIYSGEFRSFARAHLLHSTLSSRMWIKQWNQRNEDLLVNVAEPLATYAWFALDIPYPTGFFNEAWRWHLQNQPHDSICGCSIDQTHEEMKARYSWAQSIGEAVVNEAKMNILEKKTEAETSCAVLLNGTASNTLTYAEFDVPEKITPTGVKTPDGKIWKLQRLGASTPIVFELTAGTAMVKLALKMFTSRKIMGWYINEGSYFPGKESELLEIRAVLDTTLVGKFDIDYWKKVALDIIASKKYKKFHVVATRPVTNIYGVVLPLKAWAATKIDFATQPVDASSKSTQVTATKNSVETPYFSIKFNKNGSFNLIDHQTSVVYPNLHVFEDLGDRGDEYTFGRLGPESVKVSKVNRKVASNGAVFTEIQQTLQLELFEEADDAYAKRVGKTTIDVETTFRFYSDLRRIDIETSLVNTAKDHRLRVIFNLPFKASETLTSTHFGTIKRNGDPEKLEQFIEQPEGIQPEKRYIRVEDPAGTKGALTLANKGLPEVELVEGSKLALTLIRAIGNLSRGDIPERPVHAGPAEKTPAAQELGTPYKFSYSIKIHDAKDPLYASDDYAESFCIKPTAMLFPSSGPDQKLLVPLIEDLDPWIRISSMRVRENRVLVTMFNLADEKISTKMMMAPGIGRIAEIKVDGTVKNEIAVDNGAATLDFEPHEIKMCQLG